MRGCGFMHPSWGGSDCVSPPLKCLLPCGWAKKDMREIGTPSTPCPSASASHSVSLVLWKNAKIHDVNKSTMTGCFCLFLYGELTFLGEHVQRGPAGVLCLPPPLGNSVSSSKVLRKRTGGGGAGIIRGKVQKSDCIPLLLTMEFDLPPL